MTAQNAGSFEPEDWPVAFFDPSAAQIATALAFVALGLGATLAIARLGGGGAEPAPGGNGGASGARGP